MLSQDLQHVHDRIAEAVRDGYSLNPMGLAGLCTFLKAAAEDVRQLEAHTVPLPARLADDLPGNVMSVTDRLIARGTVAMQRADRPGADPGGDPGGGPRGAA